MVAENKVQFICSDNLNAPTLPNSWGVLIDVLDAALVNGLALPSVSSVLVEGSVVNITFSSAHKIKLFQTVLLSGFNPDISNKKWRVIGIPSDLTIAIDRDEQVLTVSTIGQARLPPLGYEKPFSATGKGVYRNANTDAEHRPFLRVDCTQPSNWGVAYAKVARVGLMTECTSIDDVTSGLCLPVDTVRNWESTGSLTTATTFYAKWFYSSYRPLSNNGYTSSPDGNKKWTIVGDESAFYLIVANSAAEFMKQVYGFGVYDTFKHVPYPYFLGAYHANDATTSVTTSVSATNQTLPWRGYMATPTGGGYSDNYHGAGVSMVLIMSSNGSATTTNTYLGKHASTLASNAFIPQFVMLNMQGKFKHIMHALWTPNTNQHFKTQAFDGDMFLLEPAQYRSEYGPSDATHTMPFYLGSL